MSAVIIIGGCTQESEKGALKSIEVIRLKEKDGEINASQVNWGTLETPRRSPSVFYHTNSSKMFVFGGCDQPKNHLNSCEIVGGGMVVKSITFSALYAHSCAAFCRVNNSDALIIGGFDGYNCLKQVVYIDIENASVKTLPDFCTKLKNSVALSISSRSILIIGGWDEKETLRTVFKIDLDNNSERYSTEMKYLLPYPVEGHGAVLYNNAVYIIGGYDGVEVKDTIIRLDLSTGNKEIIPVKLDVARENHVSALLDEKYLVVAGGWDGKKALDSVEIFEVLKNDPYLKASYIHITLQSPRNRPAAVVI